MSLRRATITTAAATCALAATALPASAVDTTVWRVDQYESFTGATLDTTRWAAYSGHPGDSPASAWSPSHLRVHDGMLTITNTRENGVWTGGGLSNGRSWSATSGKVEVRMRTSGPAAGVTVVALLWPQAKVWPPEIDFAENRSGSRTAFDATLHYDPSNRMVHSAHGPLDMTQWHTYGVEWSAGVVRYLVDYRVWATVRNAGVPTQPMHVAVQMNATSKAGASTPAVSSVDVDWIGSYSAR